LDAEIMSEHATAEADRAIARAVDVALAADRTSRRGDQRALMIRWVMARRWPTAEKSAGRAKAQRRENLS
jgi:hypothetical protein